MAKGTEASEGRGVAADALDNLVGQFSSKYDCFRELVQNSIDAGSHLIEVWTEFEPDGSGTGTATVHVDDDGQGMDRTIIDGQLTRLFSSRKEGDLTKIGKFGIGFVSIFALEPEAVLIHTGRGGEYWEVLFDKDRSFRLKALDRAVEGTQITLFLRQNRPQYATLVEKTRAALTHWCSHSETQITFEDRSGDGEAAKVESVDRPFAVKGELMVRHSVPGTEIVAAFDRTPEFGLYNRGLALSVGYDGTTFLGERAERFGHISFKIKSRYLEHTLSRENVIRDRNYRRAMKLLDRVVDEQLFPKLVDAVMALASVDRSREQERRFQALSDFLRHEPPKLFRQILDKKFLQTHHQGQLSPREALAAIGEGQGAPPPIYIAPSASPVTQAAAEWFTVFDGRASKRGTKAPHSKLLLRSLHEAHLDEHSGFLARLLGHKGHAPNHLVAPKDAFFLVKPVEPPAIASSLLTEASELLVRLRITELSLQWMTLSSDDVDSAPGALLLRSERCGEPIDPAADLVGASVALLINDAFNQKLIALAESKLDVAAYLLAQRLVLSSLRHEPSALGLVEVQSHGESAHG